MSGELLPDEKRFGVFWMPRRQMEAAFDMEGAFNDVSLRLLRGTDEAEVIDRLDAILKPFGSIGAIGRDHHISARFLADEIKQLRATGLVAPTVFLAVAAFLLNIVLSRRITYPSFDHRHVEGVRIHEWGDRLALHAVDPDRSQERRLVGSDRRLLDGKRIGATLQRVLSVPLFRLSARFASHSCSSPDHV